MSLKSQLVNIADINQELLAQMHALMDKVYYGTSAEKIKRDLLGHGIRFQELQGSVEERMETIKSVLYQHISHR